VAKPRRGDITGLILAGGRATRMGGIDKGLIEVDGKPMVQHVIERLRPQVGEVIINANRNADRYAAFGARVVIDQDEGDTSFAGPLAGILAGLQTAMTTWIVCVPCDAPRVPLDLAERMAQAIGRARAAVARTMDGAQPVFCLLHRGLADQLARRMRNGDRKTGDWLRAVGAIEVLFDDASAFANFNTPDDLRRDDVER